MFVCICEAVSHLIVIIICFQIFAIFKERMDKEEQTKPNAWKWNETIQQKKNDSGKENEIVMVKSI